MKALLRDSRLQPLFALSMIYLLLSLLLRLLLWWRFGLPEQVGAKDLFAILAAGVLNDLVVLIYLNGPASLYLLLMPERVFKARWHQGLLACLLFFSLFGMLYLAGTEYFFFEEFDSRFNLVAVDYLIYPHEVLVNIWDSYPVLRIMLIDLVAAGLLFRWVWPRAKKAFQVTARVGGRLKVLGVHALLLGACVALVSTDSLAVSANRVTNQLTYNGISSLFRAFRTNELNYDAYYRTIDRDRAFGLVKASLAADGTGFSSREQDSLNRTHAVNPAGLGKMNVVVIVEESLSAKYVGAYGTDQGLTPNFDRLSEQGLLFTHAYATGTRTVRGLEAIATSLPPIPSESIIKRPGNERLANWGQVMRDSGYRASFLYGGYGYFDNMNYFFENNGFEISDRTDIPEPTFANIWGVSDEDLFHHALDYFDRLHGQGEPFFSIIMTTSNHKPYTFPEGIEGVPAKGGGRNAGIRYADYALGRFFAAAPERPWFDDTVFVVVADHCARVYGRAQVPVRNYEIPLLIYAPGRISPRKVETMTSQIDIAPTVMGLLGLPYSAPFYGRNVLSDRPGEAHPILLNHNHDVALYQDDRLIVLGLNGAAEVYTYDREQNLQIPAPWDPDLIDLATAYFQTAFELFRTHKYQ